MIATARNLPMHKHQRGQALTEFVIVSLFLLVPLFLIIPVVAKLISQKQDVEIAARYAAWERTVWYQNASAGNLDGYSGPINAKSDADVSREIDARIFAQDTQPIVSGSVVYELDPFSRRQNGNLEALAKEKNAGGGNGPPEFATQSATQTAPSGIISGAVEITLDAISSFSRFNLNTDGLYDAVVSLDLIDLSPIFDLTGIGLDNLSISSNNAILAESWEAGGTEHAQYRVSGLVPQALLDNSIVEDAQDIGSDVPILQEFAPDCLDFGHTDLEPVPAHRLGPRVGVRGQGPVRCNL